MGDCWRVYLVEERANPTTDYFLLPQFSDCMVKRCRFTELPEPQALDGAVVLFVRYLPAAWRQLVARERHRLKAVLFFMDDDVLDSAASAGMPWRYRLKLARLASWHSQWLRDQHVRLWVSTPYLARKYADWPAQSLQPAPVAGRDDLCRLFYHGSASHAAEIRWLKPVMEQVLQQNERIHFELSGGRDIYRLYRGLPRVTVVHPMQWPAYQGFLAMPGRHIGLAPQLGGAFNRARSYTKFFDITRAGAVGLYAQESAFADVIRHKENGLLLAMEPQRWVDALLQLAGDEARRQQLQHEARLTVESLAAAQQQASASLLDGVVDGI